MARFILLLCCLGLAACGSPDYDTGVSAPVECAPFARALTGVTLWGEAADWWPLARGRYERSHTPKVGSLMVFQGTRRLPSGHVAVVSRVVSGHEIRVTQANWVHHKVTTDQPVVDLSGDWSLVRVWWPPAGQIGATEYPVLGFIRPQRPADHDTLIGDTPRAVRIAEGER